MHSLFKKLLTVCALVCMVSLLLAPAAAAEGTDTVPMEGTLALTGTMPAGAAPYRFTLERQDPANPMPDDSTEDTKTISMETAGAFDFGDIKFTKVGTYVYTITQEPGSAPNVTYDSRVYTATVFVEWDAEVGGALKTTLILTVTGVADKQDEIAFENIGIKRPKPDPDPTPTPTVTPEPVQTPAPSQPPIFGWLPQTSDDAPLLLWAVLGGAALIVLVVLLLRKTRKNKNDPK